MSNLAISYARFSSAPQGEGHSLTRQIEAAEAYATANNLVIDRDLSLSDPGLSAWDRSNIQKGALGLFLKEVEGGKVPVGSTLIVESFDRLSRATPRQALNIFTRLIDAGLNVVTLTDPPKRFSAASVDANMFELFEALMQMHRAHGESERKSQLLASSWEARRKKAITNGNVAIEHGLLAMIQRVKDNETELVRIEKLIEAQQRKVNILATQEGGGASRMTDLIHPEGSHQKRRYKINWPQEHRFFKLPCQAIVTGKVINPFKHFTMRSKHELHAMKLYLYFASIRGNQSFHSMASYETIFDRTKIPERDIRKAISLLISTGLLVSVDRDHKQMLNKNEPNKYYLAGYLTLVRAQIGVGQAAATAPVTPSTTMAVQP